MGYVEITRAVVVVADPIDPNGANRESFESRTFRPVKSALPTIPVAPLGRSDYGGNLYGKRFGEIGEGS